MGDGRGFTVKQKTRSSPVLPRKFCPALLDFSHLTGSSLGAVLPQAYHHACANGHADCVKVLLQVCAPSALGGVALPLCSCYKTRSALAYPSRFYNSQREKRDEKAS